MKIVQLTASRSFGSVERQMLGLGESLPREFATVFVSFAEGGCAREFLNRAEIAGFRAIRLRHDTPRLRSACRDLSGLLKELKADILCCRGYKATLLGRIAARKAGIPVFAVSHGWTGQSPKVHAYETAERFALRWMDRVVAVSHAQAERVRNGGVAPERILVIPDAVRAERFATPQASFRDKLRGLFPVPPELIVGAAGRLSREKGFDVFIDAARQIAGTHPAAGFVLFGDGVMAKKLSRQVAARGLKDKFVLAGHSAELDCFLPHFDLMVLPSFTEGLPNVVLEAFAAGVPVVATKVGGTPEVVEHGVNGLLVPPRDSSALAQAIEEILGAPDRRRRMGLSGKELVQEQFSFQSQSKEYQELFLNLAPRPRPELSSHAERAELPGARANLASMRTP